MMSPSVFPAAAPVSIKVAPAASISPASAPAPSSAQEPAQWCSVEFDDDQQWLDSYQRNNKANGSKNLRCFPFHTRGEHQTGFCGRSIRATFRCPAEEIRADASDGGDGVKREIPVRCALALMCPTVVGDPLPKEKLFCIKTLTAGHLRTPKTPLAAMLPGAVVGSTPGASSTSLTASSRDGTTAVPPHQDILHTFRVYVFQETRTPGVYEVVASCESPPWKLYCRRRNHLKSAAAVAVAEAASISGASSSRASTPTSLKRRLSPSVSPSVSPSATPSTSPKHAWRAVAPAKRQRRDEATTVARSSVPILVKL